MPSNRHFGLFFALLCLLLGLYVGWRGASMFIVLSCILASAVIGVTAISMPRVFAPLVRCWMMLGEIMGMLVTPLVPGALFFC